MSKMPTKPLVGTVLPPRSAETALPIAAPLHGIPLFNRIRYREVRRELEEYKAVIDAKNNVIESLTHTRQVTTAYQLELVRTERLDDLRLLEHLKLDAELDTQLEGQLARHRESHAQSLIHRQRIADQELQALEAEARLDAFKNPAAAAPPPPPAPERSKNDRIKEEIVATRQREKDLLEALVESCGGEENLSEDDHEFIRDVKLATRKRLQELAQELHE